MADELLERFVGHYDVPSATAVDETDDSTVYLEDQEPFWIHRDALPDLLFGRGLVMNIEALVVALVVVIALVVLGEMMGKALRSVLALSPTDHPLAATTIRSHRRQKLAMGAMCLVSWSPRD